MRGFWAIALKELMHIRRDPSIVFFALVVPCMQLLILGFAFDFDVRHLSTAVVDYDNSRESRELIQSMVNTQYVRVTSYQPSTEQAVSQVRAGRAWLAVIIPPDFGRTRSAMVLLDGSDAQVASRAAAAIRGLGTAGLVKTGTSLDLHCTILYNPSGKTSLFTIPGLIGVIIQLVSVVLTGLSLVKEREQGTLEQIMVTPVGRAGLMLGKMAPYAVMAMVEMFVVLYVAWLLFGITIAGSFWALLFMSVPFLLAALSLGLLISTVARSQTQALMAVVVIMVPSILLSGFIFPLDNLPLPLYIISQFIPVTHYMIILRGTIIRGASMAELYPQVIVLWAMAVGLVSLAALRFRKSIS